LRLSVVRGADTRKLTACPGTARVATAFRHSSFMRSAVSDLREHIVCQFREKAEELRRFAGASATDPWRRAVILAFARDCEALADSYEDQKHRKRRRQQ
jgi:hypothetical protein